MQFYKMTLDPHQEEFVKAIYDPQKLVVFCNSVAGSGKTTLAFGAAHIMYDYKKKYNYDGIIYIVSPYGEEKQGYLPGGLTEKSEVYFEPAYQAMLEVDMNTQTDIINESMANKKHGTGYVKMLTHTFLRGSNLDKKVIIIDEAQNFTVGELKKVLTRVKDTCKVIVIGHTGQIDISGKSGFARYIKHYSDQDKAAICKLTVNYRGWISSHADLLEE